MITVRCPTEACIKCNSDDPLNSLEEFNSPELLAYHFRARHTQTTVCLRYADLIFYIHERLDELNKEYDRSAAYAINNSQIRIGYHMMIEELEKLIKHC